MRQKNNIPSHELLSQFGLGVGGGEGWGDGEGEVEGGGVEDGEG